MNITVFPAWRMSPDAFAALETAEIERWRAGLPLLHREFLAEHYGSDPAEIFEATEAVKLLSNRRMR